MLRLDRFTAGETEGRGPGASRTVELALAVRRWYEADQRRLAAGRELRKAKEVEKQAQPISFGETLAFWAVRNAGEALDLAKRDERRARRRMAELCRQEQEQATTMVLRGEVLTVEFVEAKESAA